MGFYLQSANSTISLYSIYILTCLKETVKIYLKKLRVSYYRVYFNGKIHDMNKLFNPCDPFFYGNVCGKERKGSDRFFAITPTSIQQQSNTVNYMKTEIIPLFIFYLEPHTK